MILLGNLIILQQSYNDETQGFHSLDHQETHNLLLIPTTIEKKRKQSIILESKAQKTIIKSRHFSIHFNEDTMKL